MDSKSRNEIKKIKELFQIDQEKCTLCKLCVNFCPKQNLSIEETENNPIIKFGNKCTFCMRCFDYCPQDAIIITERTKDIEKYRRFRNQVPGFKLKNVK